MSTRPASGVCPRCNHANVYTKITCDYCGDRLPWAATFAATSGEKCTHCGHFNPYKNGACVSCGEELPWAEAAATRHLIQGRGEAEQKSLGLIITLCALGFILALGFVMHLSAPIK